jgi:hypothetical protein
MKFILTWWKRLYENPETFRYTVPSESDMNQYIEEVIKEMQANKEKR